MDIGIFYAAVYVFCRLAPITLVAPAMFFAQIPLTIRTLVTLTWATVIATSLSPAQLSSIPHGFFPAYIASEFMLGIIMSAGFHLASAALNMASQLIDIQIGIAAGATFDPVNFQMTSPTGTLLSLLAVATFFFTNLHYEFLYFFSEVFRLAPPGAFYLGDSGYFSALSKLFALGFIVVSPVIVVLWLVDFSLALISRSMPQAQIYFVAMPLKIIIGILVLAFVVDLSHNTFYNLIMQSMSPWQHIQRY